MADYDWFADQWQPTPQEKEAAEREKQGFVAVWEEASLGRSRHKVKYYRCLRGCGTLVWDLNAHIKNVCPHYNKD